MSILPAHFSRQERRAAIKALERDNDNAPVVMTEVVQERWPASMVGNVLNLWRSRRFLAQLYAEPDGVLRLSINRTTTATGDRWVDGITWDELQAVKAECGFGHVWAVEVYPPADCVVNVANVRHLWLLPKAPTFAWKQS